MSQRLLLEGADPEALLARAQQEYGPAVTVVQAERVRTGGVLGFFARETYALTLEVPGERAALTSGAAADAGAGDDARLAEEMADAERMRRELALGVPPETPAVRDDAAAADAFSDLLRGALQGDDPEVAGAGGRGFSQALFPSVPLASMATPPQDGEATAVVLHSWGVQRDVLDPLPASTTAATLLRLGVPQRALPAQSRIDDAVAVHDALARVGVPTLTLPRGGELLVVVGTPDLAVRVATQVTAWAGSTGRPVVMAGACPAIPGHGRRVQTPGAAARLRERLGTDELDGPMVVALGASPGEAGAREAAGLAAAFGAEATWAVVDAGWTAQRREAVLASLRAEVAELAVAAVGLSEAQAPAALLDASAPVAWLDGVPSSRAVWTAVLEERIGATGGVS